MLKRKFVIADNERALLFKERLLTEVLTPGVYRYWDFKNQLKARVFDVTSSEVVQKDVKALMLNKPELLGEHFTEVSTNENEVALISVNGQVTELLAPQTQKLYWNTEAKMAVERINIDESFQVSEKDLKRLAKVAKSSVLSKGLVIKEVINKQVGLLYVDGRLERVLKAGQYGFWNYNKTIALVVVDTRAQLLDVSGQEILTKDKVSLRVNLTATYQVEDAVVMAENLPDASAFIYNALQLALRQSVGTQTLDALLADKTSIDTYVQSVVSKKVAEFGLKLIQVGVKDIILPGEMKTILNQVVEAEKAAKANVIKRREETAATRSLLNTAKLMDESATLQRLKELETLEKVADKVSNITVFGGLDGLTKDSIKLMV